MLQEEQYAPERAVFESWARGFNDRDGKFVQEFQISFESGLWELYLNASIAALGMQCDMSFNAPDFVITAPAPVSLEATVARPAREGKPAHGFGIEDIPTDFTQFNIAASLRITNSFDAKVRRYRHYYADLPHVANRPFVIAIAAFDRPFAHFAASRPVLAAMYGLYFDEAATHRDAPKVASYQVSAAPKSPTVDVPMGLFCDDRHSDVSAIIYSALATWGKVRALADNPSANTIYTSYHPSDKGLMPEVRHTPKSAYREHLLDGMYVLHNPYAKRPLPLGSFSHQRVAEIRVDDRGDMHIAAPDDFLLLRTLMSVKER
jgi:hypothetical protein